MSVDRAGYIAGLRALADALEADERLELPYYGRSATIDFPVYAGALDAFTAYRSLLNAPVDVDSTASNYKTHIDAALVGLHLSVRLADEAAFTEPPAPVLPALVPQLLASAEVTA